MCIFNNYTALNMPGPMRTLGKKKKNKPKWKKEKERTGRVPPLEECLWRRKREAAVRRQVYGVRRLQGRNRHKTKLKGRCEGDSRKGEGLVWNSSLPFFTRFIYLSTGHTQTPTDTHRIEKEGIFSWWPSIISFTLLI